MLKSNICLPEICSKVFRFNDIGLLARVGCKNAGACESILKQTSITIFVYNGAFDTRLGTFQMYSFT